MQEQGLFYGYFENGVNGFWITPEPVVIMFVFICLSRIESYYQDTLARIRHTRDIWVGRLVTELESGGNIRFEDGLPSSVW